MLVADPHLKPPRTYQWNVALEQSLGSNQSLSATYIGAIGRDLLRLTNLFNPNLNFQVVELTDNTATSDYHALQLKFQRRLSRGLRALASYSLSHWIDIASTDSAANELNTPGSVANPNVDRGNSDFDIRHSFTAGLTYDLPTPGAHKALRTAFGGWSVDTFVLARSAPPVDVVAGLFLANGVALNPRPNVIPGVPLVLHGSQYPGGKILNSGALLQRLLDSRAISGAMCCAVSKQRKRTLHCNGNFTLQRSWDFASDPSSSTSSTTRTSVTPTTT